MTLTSCISSDNGNLSLTGKDVFAYMNAEKLVSLKSILKSDPKHKPPILNDQYKEDPAAIQKAIVVIIKQYTEQLNTFKDIAPTQLTAIALDLIEHFKYDTLDDVMLMFKYARQGWFSYHARFDISVISTWIPKYKELKAEAREKIKLDEKGRAGASEIDDKRLKNFYKKQLENKRIQTNKSKSKRKKIPANSPLADSTQLQREIKSTVGSLTEKELTENYIKTRVSSPDLAMLFKDELILRELTDKPKGTVLTIEQVLQAQEKRKQLNNKRKNARK